MTLATTYTPLVIYIVVYGVADGFFFTSLSVILLTASPLKTAAVIGWEMMLVSVFLASGPPLAGKNYFRRERNRYVWGEGEGICESFELESLWH